MPRRSLTITNPKVREIIKEIAEEKTYMSENAVINEYLELGLKTAGLLRTDGKKSKR